MSRRNNSDGQGEVSHGRSSLCGGCWVIRAAKVRAPKGEGYDRAENAHAVNLPLHDGGNDAIERRVPTTSTELEHSGHATRVSHVNAIQRRRRR